MKIADLGDEKQREEKTVLFLVDATFMWDYREANEDIRSGRTIKI